MLVKVRGSGRRTQALLVRWLGLARNSVRSAVSRLRQVGLVGDQLLAREPGEEQPAWFLDRRRAPVKALLRAADLFDFTGQDEGATPEVLLDAAILMMRNAAATPPEQRPRRLGHDRLPAGNLLSPVRRRQQHADRREPDLR
jgi:hypothetical protein